MLEVKIGDILVGTGTTIAEGKVIAITPDGNYVVEIVKENENTRPLQVGQLYLIDRKWDFYSVKPKPKPFFKLGKTYRFSWSTNKYKVLDIYKVQNPAYDGAEVAAVALVTNGSGEERIDMLVPSDFSSMTEL